jgi:signal transduction histidine kinase
VAFRDYLHGKFAGRRIDVVIANTTAALEFALRHREGLFPGVPIVFVGSAMPELTDPVSSAGVTGVSSDARFADTLELALKLHPSVRRVFVVAQAQNVADYGERVMAAVRQFSAQVELSLVTHRSVPELLAAIKEIPAQSLIFYTRYAAEDGQVVINPYEVVRLLAEASPVPIYAAHDSFLGTGVVGGMMRGSRATGARVAEIARQILEGTPAEQIPIDVVPAVPTFDWRQIQRWGIDPLLLPPQSDIQFRTPSAWESYRAYVVGAVALLLTQTALITGLLIQRRHRRRAEGELRASEAALRKSYERNRDLGARLLQAQETEHARIARELHDDICQRMLLLTIELEALGPAKPAGTSAAEALKLAQDIASSLHELSHRLHPTRLRLIGLVAALDRLCAEVSRAGIAVEFTHDNVPATLPPDLMLCLFRVVLKYSNAQRLTVDLNGGSRGLVLTIADNGVGFHVNAAWGKGVGLVSMVERLEATGGTLDVSSTPGAGTQLTATIPAHVMQTTG